MEEIVLSKQTKVHPFTVLSLCVCVCVSECNESWSKTKQRSEPLCLKLPENA